MNTSHFADRLTDAVKARQTPLVVGLDPRFDSLPNGLKQKVRAENAAGVAKAFRRFCFEILDAIHSLIPAIKVQSAFFEQLGPLGMQAMFEVVQRAKQLGLIVIIDVKRGDIGSTSLAYARAYLGRRSSDWRGDAMTINPYLGDDAMGPMIDVAVASGCGLFVLVKTSNPGSAMLQDLKCNGLTLYRHVAQFVQREARKTVGKSGFGCVGAVVGATHPEQLVELRKMMPDAILLIPGFGAQGGTAEDVAGGFNSNGLGAVINSSRDIIFAFQRQEYQQFAKDNWLGAVERATRDAILLLNEYTPAGMVAQ